MSIKLKPEEISLKQRPWLEHKPMEHNEIPTIKL